MGLALPLFTDVRGQLTTTSAGAADGSTVVATGGNANDQYYRGMTVEILGSTTASLVGARREVTSYVAGTGTYLVDPPFDAQVPISTTFQVLADRPGAGSSAGALIAYIGIADAGSTAGLLRDAALTQANDYWNGSLVIMLSGANVGLSRWAEDFLAATDDLVLANDFPNAIAAGDTYAIASFNSQAAVADDTASALFQQVLGNKSDAAVMAVGTTASAIAYLKGIINILGGGGSTFTDASVGPSDFNAAPVSVLSLTPADVSYLDAVYLDVNGFTNGATLTAVISVRVGAGNNARTVRSQFVKDANNTLWAIIDSPTALKATATAITITVQSDNAGDVAVTVPSSYLLR